MLCKPALTPISSRLRSAALIIAVAFVSGCSVFGIRSTDEPAYEVVRSDGQFEIRQYQGYAVAETSDAGDYDEATRQSFKRLADYIFGENGESAEISMTAPVLQSEKGKKISMTAPVFQAEKDTGWTMTFVLPENYSAATAPKPNDAKIELRDVPAKKVAVLCYSGTMSESRIDEHTERLIQWLQDQGLDPASDPQSAGYDPPWTLPFMRRNEIQVVVE